MTKNLRICVFVPAHVSYRMGGAQYQAEQLVQELISRPGIELSYLTCRANTQIETPYRLDVLAPLSPRWLNRLGDAGLFMRAYRRLGKNPPDIIYQRVGGAFTGVAAFYARRAGARFIWHVAHDYDVMPGKLAHKVAGLKVNHTLEKKALEYGLRHADVIVVQTEFQAARVREHYGRTDAVVIPNFHPAPQESFAKTPERKILWIANFKRWKRPEVFVALAEKMQHLQNVQFIMVGAPSPDQGWQQSLEKRISALGNLSYLGEVSQSRVNQLLAEAHLFVNTSEVEGFANTFVQAWLREVPVISLTVDPDGILDRKKIGICCGNEDALFKATLDLLTDQTERMAMGRRAREHAEFNHSLGNVKRLADLVLGHTAR